MVERGALGFWLAAGWPCGSRGMRADPAAVGRRALHLVLLCCSSCGREELEGVYVGGCVCIRERGVVAGWKSLLDFKTSKDRA